MIQYTSEGYMRIQPGGWNSEAEQNDRKCQWQHHHYYALSFPNRVVTPSIPYSKYLKNRCPHSKAILPLGNHFVVTSFSYLESSYPGIRLHLSLGTGCCSRGTRLKVTQMQIPQVQSRPRDTRKRKLQWPESLFIVWPILKPIFSFMQAISLSMLES